MTDISDKEIAERIQDHYPDIFKGSKQLVELYGLESEGRPYVEWHDEIVRLINELRINEGISVDKAAKKIAEPFMKKHYVTFESLVAAYWTRQRERTEEDFLRALSDQSIELAVEAYKQLTETSKRKLVP
jgi:hypothetical protein